MSVCSCICFDFTASWTEASADEVCQYYGDQPYHHGCKCVLNLSYDHYYYYGVCDANMVLLTTTSMNHLVENGTFLLNQVNENPGVTLALYYVLPRCLMAMSFVYVSNIVNQVIRKSLKNAMKMEEKAATDEMTGLYNKNKLLAIIRRQLRMETA